jgi:hypothetical protein
LRLRHLREVGDCSWSALYSEFRSMATEIRFVFPGKFSPFWIGHMEQQSRCFLNVHSRVEKFSETIVKTGLT